MPSLIAVSLPPDAAPVGPFQLDGDTAVIGRDAACQFTVPHPSVGARHARLTRRGSRYFLEPLGADSPLVNSAPVTAPAALRHDDRIGIGGFVFRFVDDRPAGLVAGAQWVPDYLAPEQVNERPDAPPSEATDLHAVGVILFHMLTGELPFPPDLKEMGKLDAIAKRRFASCVRRCAE